MKHSFFQNSKCLGQYLHRFRIGKEYPQGTLEVCEICHKQKFFRVIDGKFNNQEYMSYNIRLILPDFHPYYYHEYQYDSNV